MKNTCTSCGKKFDSEGVYCGDCLDEKGKLKPFEEVRNNLGEHIQKTQGYAKVVSLKIADSILQQHPAWKKRFEKIESKKRSEMLKSVTKKWIISVIAGVIICAIVLISLFQSGMFDKTLDYLPKMIIDDCASETISSNNQYVFFKQKMGSDESMATLSMLNTKTKKITRISSPCSSKDFIHFAKSNDYITWLDQRNSPDDENLRDIFVSDYKGNEKRVTTYPTGSRKNLEICNNWIVYTEFKKSVISSSVVNEFSVYAHDITNLDNEPIECFTQEDYIDGETGYWKIVINDNNEVCVVLTFWLPKGNNARVTYNLTQNTKIHDEISYFDTLKNSRIVARFDNYVLFHTYVDEYSEFYNSNPVNYTTPRRIELKLLDTESNNVTILGEFEGFLFIANMSESPNKCVFLTTHVGLKGVSLEGRERNIVIFEKDLKLTTYYVIDYETKIIKKLFETKEAPDEFTYNNETFVYTICENTLLEPPTETANVSSEYFLNFYTFNDSTNRNVYSQKETISDLALTEDAIVFSTRNFELGEESEEGIWATKSWYHLSQVDLE